GGCGGSSTMKPDRNRSAMKRTSEQDKRSKKADKEFKIWKNLLN
ncbi:17408_t:CDS:1, partial [Dentiscutata heterogama]